MLGMNELEAAERIVQRALGKLAAVEVLIAEAQHALQTGNLPSSISASLYYSRWDLAEACGNLQAVAEWLGKSVDRKKEGE